VDGPGATVGTRENYFLKILVKKMGGFIYILFLAFLKSLNQSLMAT
jgi:hypothetical protein